MSGKIKVILVGMFLGILMAVCWAEQQQDGSESISRPKLKVVRGAKGWALGCSGVLTERNHGRHDCLSPYEVNEKNIADEKNLLDEWWGISSREDLFEILRRLDNDGHRSSFEGWGRYLQSLDEQQYQEILKKYAGNKEKLHEIGIVKQYYKELGPKSLLGWDYSRYICLCRWSYLVGYISEEEAWERIMPVAKMLQETFDSWEDLGRNYIIGRRFWSYKETKEDNYRYEDALQRLLDMQGSPWNKYSWDMDLSGWKENGGSEKGKKNGVTPASKVF